VLKCRIILVNADGEEVMISNSSSKDLLCWVYVMVFYSIGKGNICLMNNDIIHSPTFLRHACSLQSLDIVSIIASSLTQL